MTVRITTRTMTRAIGGASEGGPLSDFTIAAARLALLGGMALPQLPQ
jgi:hypothetical protein